MQTIERTERHALHLTMRLLQLLHRYLAIAAGMVMTVWCLSGFVMMYHGYPELRPDERWRGLEPLRFDACCNEATAVLGNASRFHIHMRASEPTLVFNRSAAVSLQTGQSPEALSPEESIAVAQAYAARQGLGGVPRISGQGMDQWTVAIAWEFPTLYRLALDDEAGTELYVPASSAQVILDTNRRERMWAWLGAVPHWLYPMQLRQNTSLWSSVVIAFALAGSFLVATGIFLGIRRMRYNSPILGWWHWHYMSGLIFGGFLLSWVFSGLLTMGPWGWLVPDGEGQDYRSLIQGEPDSAQLSALLDALSKNALPNEEYVELRAAPLAGDLYVMAYRGDGSSERFDSRGEQAPLREKDIETALAPINNIASIELMVQEDSYYYGHRREVELPVYRIQLRDEDGTHLYINGRTGAVQVVDRTQKRARWLREGLHDLDFAGLRERPVWDVLVLFLLSGVTLICVTGTWMAFRRAVADLRTLFS